MEAGMVISAPVCGLRPLRLARLDTENEPKPVNEMEPPRAIRPFTSSSAESSTLPVMA